MGPKAIPEGFSLDEPAAAQSIDVPSGFQLDDEASSDQAAVDKYLKQQETHGGFGSQLLTAAEGAADTASFGLAGVVENKLADMGVTSLAPEERLARREANPWSRAGGQVAGLFVPGLGAAGLMEKAGMAGATALGLGAAETALGKIGQIAVKSGIETAIFQAGDETSKMLANDPGTSVPVAIASIGFSGLLGAGVGGSIGAISPLWKSVSSKKVGDYINIFKGEVSEPLDGAIVADASEGLIGGLTKKKANAKEIEAAAREIGAPVLESQISASKHIQDMDSMLMQSPTMTGVARQQLMQQGLDAADNAVAKTLQEGSELSAVDIGNNLKASLKGKLEAEVAPIEDLYNNLKATTQHIPVDKRATSQIAKNIKTLENYKFKGSAEQKLGDYVIDNLRNLNTVDDIKRFKTMLNSELAPTASAAERNAVGKLSEKLADLEENTILRSAKKIADETGDMDLRNNVVSLIDQRKLANSSYKALKEKMADLGELLGKKRPKGAGDFVDFIDNLTPEAITKKLFAKNNSESLAWFSKSFPEESQALFQHQKGVLREAATKDGILNGKKVLAEVDKLSPEVQKLMFSEAELKSLNAARTYLESIPKNINPSGTSKAEAYRRFFTNPATATIESIRDLGLGKLMKSVVKPGEEEIFAKSVFPAFAKNVAEGEVSPTAFKSAVDYGLRVVKGERLITNSANAIFQSGRGSALHYELKVSDKERDNLDKKVEEFKKDPSKLMAMGGETGHYLPGHATAMGETAGRVIQYLDTVKPKPVKLAPLDPELEPSQMQKSAYHRTLGIAEKPLSILSHLDDGTLIAEDLKDLTAMYPGLYNKIASAITNSMIDHTSKGGSIPYATKQSLSLFLAQPMDSSLTPQSIQSAQAVFAVQKGNKMAASMEKPQGNTKALDSASSSYQTSSEASANRQQSSKM